MPTVEEALQSLIDGYKLTQADLFDENKRLRDALKAIANIHYDAATSNAIARVALGRNT